MSIERNICIYHIIYINTSSESLVNNPTNNCTSLYILSTIACQLSQCLSDDELAILAADLVVLSDMLANIAARQSIRDNKDDKQ